MRFLLPLILILTACHESFESPELEFYDDRIVIRFATEQGFKQILLKEQSQILWSMPEFSESKELSILYPWESRELYTLHLYHDSQEKIISIQCPERKSNYFLTSNGIDKIGLNDSSELYLLLNFNDSNHFYIQGSESDNQESIAYKLDSQWHKIRRGQRVTLALDTSSEHQMMELYILSKSDSNRKNIRLVNLNKNTDNLAEITNIAFTDESQRLTQTLLLRRNEFEAILPSFLHEKKYLNYQEAVTFFEVEIENKSPKPALFSVLCRIQDRNAKDADSIFRPYEWKERFFNPHKQGSAYVAGYSRARCLVPLFVDPSAPLVGKWQALFSLDILNSNKIIDQKSYSFEIKENSSSLYLIYFALYPFHLFFLFFMIKKIKKYLVEFSYKEMVYISALSVFQIAAGVILQLINSAFLSVLGPFSLFVSSFFSTLIHMYLIVLIVHYFQKKMSIALFTLSHYVINLLLFAQFYIFSFFSMFSRLFFMEYLLNRKRKSVLLTLILLSIIDMFFSLYIFFELRIVYEYYYSNWYLVLYLFINSLLAPIFIYPIAKKNSESLKEIWL